METKEEKISVKDLTDVISMLIKEDIIATYTQKDAVLGMTLLNGQKFELSISEIKN